MKVLTKKDEQVADVTIVGSKDAPLKATICVGGKTIEAPDVDLKMTKVGNNLETAIRVPGVANFKLLLEPDDVKALKSLMNKEVIKFMMKAFF